MSTRFTRALCTVCGFTVFLVGGAFCQPDTEADNAENITVTVTARQWEEPLQESPGSVSVISSQGLATSGTHTVGEAERLSPNVTLPDFSVRWLSFPFIRGIGSGRNTPAVTTIIDGVPQLSYLTANQELLDVERIEVLRGPQGSLYGRNALACVVNVVPQLPSEVFIGSVRVSAGNYDQFDVRGGVGGPLGNSARSSLRLGHASRDGFTTNDVTGDRLDDRQATFGHAQVLWPEAGAWNLRLSLTGENDRDGDYALGDLASLRERPRHIAHDYQGFNRRKLAQPVFTATRQTTSYGFTSITALQQASVLDSTDADFSPLDLLRRGTDEDFRAWTQEFRLASSADKGASLRWLAGAFIFTADDEADHVTEFRPLAAEGQGVPFAFNMHDRADLQDTGVSAYGQVSLARKRAELTLGLRHDYEHRSADLSSSTDPMISPSTTLEAERDFNQTSPRVTLGYHLTPTALWYANVAKGYKTGGFNAQAPPEEAVFEEETSWTYETGVKTTWLSNRLLANLSLFRTEWDDIQLDVPAGVPGVFYINNAGAATSQGAELEVTGRPARGLELTGGLGLLDTEFGNDSQSAGVAVGGHDLPFAPRVTGRFSALYSRSLNGYRGFVRADILHTGRYYYDATNQASQAGYTLVNLRASAARGSWRLEGWVHNLFDTDYIPVAFPVTIVPSGYIGESGAPRTVGLSVGYLFP